MRVSLLYATAETASWKKRWALVGGAWDDESACCARVACYRLFDKGRGGG